MSSTYNSMMQDVYIVEEVGQVVAATAQALGRDILYMYGHPLEIVGRLQAITNSPNLKNRKFPLVVLFTDIIVRKNLPGMYGSTRLQMIIANLTTPTLSSQERLEKNFKPVLHPIKQELVYQLSRHRQFTFPDEVEYDEIDRYYWGKSGLYGNTSNTFNDYLDCVELKDFKINVLNRVCENRTAKIF